MNPFGLPPLDTRCELCGEPEYLFGLCYSCCKNQYADEDKPDRHQNEDERLDDPRHDQCKDGKFVP
jgi:hypothetical protein